MVEDKHKIRDCNLFTIKKKFLKKMEIIEIDYFLVARRLIIKLRLFFQLPIFILHKKTPPKYQSNIG